MNRLRVLILLLVSTMGLAGCAIPLQSEDKTNNASTTSSKPASELLHRMLDLTDETVRLHGGQWRYSGDDEIPWDPTLTAGFTAESCLGVQAGAEEKGSYRYFNTVFGPAVEDPEAAVEKYVTHFGQQGFRETGRFAEDVPSDFGSGHYIIVTVQDEDGTELIYQAGNHLSSLSFQGPCSNDPAMKITTT